MTATSFADRLVAGVFRAVTWPLFRIRVLGADHVPFRGPALLVSNHLTYLDAFLIGACLGPGIRFLVWKPYYDRWPWNWGLRIANAIPVSEVPRDATHAVRLARRALKSGHVVCVFAEGSISRTGELLPFKRGIEAIAKGLNIPIIPVCLGGLRNSIYAPNGRRSPRKPPHPLRHPVTVSFGAPMAPSSSVKDLRAAVERLGAIASSAKPFWRDAQSGKASSSASSS